MCKDVNASKYKEHLEHASFSSAATFHVTLGHLAPTLCFLSATAIELIFFKSEIKLE